MTMTTSTRPLTTNEKQARRRAALDAIAQKLGFANWGKFETAVKNGLQITILKP
jgi:hypothetical protein